LSRQRFFSVHAAASSQTIVLWSTHGHRGRRAPDRARSAGDVRTDLQPAARLPDAQAALHPIHELDDTLLVSCADLEERNELLAAEPGKFFITPHYDGYRALPVRLAEVGRDELTELITESWRLNAPERLLAGRLLLPSGTRTSCPTPIVADELAPPSAPLMSADRFSMRITGIGGDLEWTYFSPAVEIEPGERTGTYRPGSDKLLSDDQGRSHISAEDYAVALLDEPERGQHIREQSHDKDGLVRSSSR